MYEFINKEVSKMIKIYWHLISDIIYKTTYKSQTEIEEYFSVMVWKMSSIHSLIKILKGLFFTACIIESHRKGMPGFQICITEIKKHIGT